MTLRPCPCQSRKVCCYLYLALTNYPYPMQTLFKIFSRWLLQAIFLYILLTANILLSFLMQFSPIIPWLVLAMLFAIFNTTHFWSFLLVSFLTSRYFLLCVFSCFQFFNKLYLTLTVLAIITTPPCFSMFSSHFCSSTTPACTL